jgi:uncharacterized membrane protein
MHLTGTTTIGRQPGEVYEFWHSLEHLPTFMIHLDEVRRLDERGSHWRATAPFGRTVEWDAETVEDVPGERMAWRSVQGADIDNSGKLGDLVARYFGEEPHQQLDDDLRRLKQVIETGEVVRSDGAPGGKKARGEFPQHPAQPLSLKELAELTEDGLITLPGADAERVEAGVR